MTHNDEIIIPLILEGKTVQIITKETGLHADTIRNCAKRNNLTINSKRTKLTDDLLKDIKECVLKGLTNKQIAEKFHMSPTTARKYTKELLGLDTNSLKNKPIINKNIKLTNEQEEILYGSLLGDMSIGFQGNEARFTISQGGNQEQYFDYKCSFFKDFLGKISKTDRYDKRTNKWYHKYQVRSKTNPLFTEIYYKFYQNGVKTITTEILGKLTARSLAFWYMDDGSNSGVLATNCFSVEEVKLIQNWLFDKFNIETTVEIQINNNNKQPLLYILKKSRSIFYNLVKPYIIPEMEYKFKNWNP